MTNFRAIARQAAVKNGLDPKIFERQINAESGFNPNSGSSAGAVGIAQFMPATAKSLGINPRDPVQSLDAAAKLMAGYVRKYGGYENALRAYNAGPGAIQASKSYAETNAYVSKILGGSDPGKLGRVQSAASGGGTTTTTTTTPSRTITTPGVDPQKVALAQFVLQNNGMNPSTVAGLSAIPAPTSRTIPGTTTTVKSSLGSPAPVSYTGQAPTGAKATLQWARSTIGTSETGGANRGPRIDQWEQRFGLKGQPWCAVFTSLAVTKGGAPASARTPSVAAVRAQAQSGNGGYQKGFIPAGQAHAGDLILFGNDHIGLVESVSSKGVTMIAGNDSNRVERRTVPIGSGDIVRPKYA